MASKNKKNKGKNAFIVHGEPKCDGVLKRIFFFTKRMRKKNKKYAQVSLQDYEDSDS